MVYRQGHSPRSIRPPPFAQALEYQVQQGIVGGAKEELLLMPLMPRHVMGPELHSNVAVLRLMQEF